MKQKGQRWVLRIAIFIGSLAFLFTAVCGGVLLYAAKFLDRRADDALFCGAREESVLRLYGTRADGTYGETEVVCLSPYRKTWVALEDCAPTVTEAFLSAEDRKFYEHHGVDVGRTLRAAMNTMTKRSPTFGASTITQQVIKNISGDSDVTFRRKFNEILRAFRLEQEHSKDEILEVYLNIVPMTDGILGVGCAAKVYFGKEASELTAAEAATLAGITNAPSRYNPYTAPGACRDKRNRVLYAMYDNGKLTEEEYCAACEEPLNVKEKPPADAAVMSWFAETVLSDVVHDLAATLGMSEEAASRMLARGGFTVETTEDQRVSRILRKYLEKNQNIVTECETRGLAMAMVVADPQTGELLGVMGHTGQKSGNRLANLATEYPHTPGSVMKPLALYAPLLAEGKITAATVLDDVPVTFLGDEGAYIPYPKNSPARYDGLTTVRDALALSKNTVAVRLYGMRGAEKIYRSLCDEYGFTTLIRRQKRDDGKILSDLAASPLALGQLTYGVTLRQLTDAYSVFPGDGILRPTVSYRRVLRGDGQVLTENTKEERRLFSPEAARLSVQLLRGVTEYGTAKSLTLTSYTEVAGKTGTSGDDRDRLFVGFTGSLCAGIWCGTENGRGSVGTLPVGHLAVWDAVMKEVVEVLGRRGESFSTEGLIRRNFCRDSGKLYAPVCAEDPRGCRMESAYFLPGTEPTVLCDRHVTVRYDALTGGVATSGCAEEDIRQMALVLAPERSFPTEVTVRDAGYMFRPLPEGIRAGDSYDIPFFAALIPEGVYIGRSPGEKQYNSSCYLHDDE